MQREAIGITAIVIALTALPLRAGSLQVFAGVVGGTNSCAGDQATPVPISSYFGSDTGGFGLPLTGNGISDCGLSGQINNVTQAAGPLNTAYNLNNASYSAVPGASFSGAASATANYGTVAVSASGTLIGATAATGYAESAAFGIASDTLNVSGAGSSGYLAFDLSLNGSLEESPANGGAGQMQIEAQIGGTSEEIFYGDLSGSSVLVEGEEVDRLGQIVFGEPVPGCVIGSGIFTCTNGTVQTTMVPVSFDGPITLSFGLLAITTPGPGSTVTTDPPGMSLSGIQVYDTNGNQISDFSLQSGSGAVYGPDGIESEPANAPEPSTLLLAGMALAAAGMVRRARNS